MNKSVPNRIPVKEIERYAKHLLPKDQKVINDLHVSCLVAVPCTSLYKRVMESFQISLQLGCLNSTTPDAFAKGGVSGRASIACVPIASAKVRRIIALRKKTIWKSMKNCSLTLNFGV